MILFGAGGHGKSIIGIANSLGEEITHIYDDNPSLKSICNIPVLQYSSGEILPNYPMVIAVGNNKGRKIVMERFDREYGVLIHRSASISNWSQIGAGTVVMAQAVVNVGATIGEHCIINSCAVIEHDCTLGDFVHISPNASLAGGVTIGEGTHVGTGASIIPGITVGKWATIGAGTVIIRDIPDGVLVVGNPGRIVIKKDISFPRHVSTHVIPIRRISALNSTHLSPHFHTRTGGVANT